MNIRDELWKLVEVDTYGDERAAVDKICAYVGGLEKALSFYANRANWVGLANRATLDKGQYAKDVLGQEE